MFSSRIANLIKKEIIQARRDPRMLFLIIVAPLIQLIIFGYVASTDVRHLSTVVFDEDRTPFSRQFVESFKNSSYFDLNYYADNDSQIKDLLDSGKASVAIRIGQGFAKKIDREESAPVQILIDASNSNTASISAGYISGIIWEKTSKILSDSLINIDRSLSINAIENRIRIWYNPELKSVNFMIPALLAVLLMIQVMILSALAIVKEKEYGTLEQLIVSPLKPYEMLIGKILPFIIMGFVQVTLVLLASIFWFKVPFKGSFVLLYLLEVVYLIPTLGFGIYISTISKNQHQAMMTAFFIILPSILLSGFIFPINNMPLVIQYITNLIPIKFFLIIVRGIYQKGVGIEYLWPEVWPLLILGVLILGLSIFRFRKRLE